MCLLYRENKTVDALLGPGGRIPNALARGRDGRRGARAKRLKGPMLPPLRQVDLTPARARNVGGGVRRAAPHPFAQIGDNLGGELSGRRHLQLLVVVSHGEPVLENGADALRRALG